MTLTLTVPDITEEDDTLAAALKYARGGWYVIPVAKGKKHPGSILGIGWNEKSSRDDQVIVSWFAGSDYGIALHVGRSGAVVLDVDTPANLPGWLLGELYECEPPFQSTRTTDDAIGHYLFLQPEGRLLGNGTGQLGGEWGEVRGANGVIIVAPSVHEKAADGGLYRWYRTGLVSPLPDQIASRLHDASPAEDAASDAAVVAFLQTYAAGEDTALVSAWAHTFAKAVAAGESRHGKALSILTGALKEAKAGLFPAALAESVLRRAFLVAVAADGQGGKQGKGRAGTVATSEWDGILAWAVSQALAADDRATVTRLAEHAPGMTNALVRPEHRMAAQDMQPPHPSTPVAPSAPVPSLGGVFGDLALARVPVDYETEEAPYHSYTQDNPQSVDKGEELHPAVALELATLRTRLRAKELLDAEQWGATFREPPYLPSLTAELALADDEVFYRVDQVMPVGGNILLTAAYKAGKSSLLINLARALADGTPFLGRLPVLPTDGTVVIFNYEVSRGQFRRWLREAGIVNTDKVVVFNLRGYTMPLSAPRVQDWIVNALQRVNGAVWFVDPFARAFTGVSENDNTEVGRWLDTLDVVKERAGIGELVLPTHTGRGEMEQGMERARGATRLNDWTDVQWVLTKDKDKRRYFSASGRDVEFEECALTYDPVTRIMELGEGDRNNVALESVKNAVESIVINYATGVTKAKVEEVCPSILRGGASKERIGKAISALESDGRVVVERGKPGTPHYLFPAKTTPFGGVK